MILLNFATAIKGDSTVDSHTDWITVDSLHWGVGRAISTSGVGKDRDTSNPSISEVVITKSMDVASTDLFSQATCGKTLGKGTIHFIQTGGSDVKLRCIWKLNLLNVLSAAIHNLPVVTGLLSRFLSVSTKLPKNTPLSLMVKHQQQVKPKVGI